MIAFWRCYLCSLKIIGATNLRGGIFLGMDSFVLILLSIPSTQSQNSLWPFVMIMTGILRFTQYTHISREMLRHNDLSHFFFFLFFTELKKNPQLTLHSLFHATHDLPLISKLVFVSFPKLFLLQSRKDASRQNANALNCTTD